MKKLIIVLVAIVILSPFTVKADAYTDKLVSLISMLQQLVLLYQSQLAELQTQIGNENPVTTIPQTNFIPSPQPTPNITITIPKNTQTESITVQEPVVGGANQNYQFNFESNDPTVNDTGRNFKIVGSDVPFTVGKITVKIINADTSDNIIWFPTLQVQERSERYGLISKSNDKNLSYSIGESVVWEFDPSITTKEFRLTGGFAIKAHDDKPYSALTDDVLYSYQFQVSGEVIVNGQKITLNSFDLPIIKRKNKPIL